MMELQNLVFQGCPMLCEIAMNWSLILPEKISKSCSPYKTVFHKKIYLQGTLIVCTEGYNVLSIRKEKDMILQCLNSYFGDKPVFHDLIVRSSSSYNK